MADNTAQNGTATIATDDIGGTHYQIVKNAFGALDAVTLVSVNDPLPVMMMDNNRTELSYYAVGQASGATGVETMITLSQSSANGAPSTGTSFALAAGERFRMTSITFAARGHNTATAQITTFSIRVNSGGAAVVGSNAVMRARVATPATANAWDRINIALPDAGYDIIGSATLQWGVSANAVFTTNAPTWDVLITGYKY